MHVFCRAVSQENIPPHAFHQFFCLQRHFIIPSILIDTFGTSDFCPRALSLRDYVELLVGEYAADLQTFVNVEILR